jgi:hypothetical protein
LALTNSFIFLFVLISSNDSFSIFRHFSVDSPEGVFGWIRLWRIPFIRAGADWADMRAHLRESGALASVYEGRLPSTGCLGDLDTLDLGTSDGL